jgi:hypothetical protein
MFPLAAGSEMAFNFRFSPVLDADGDNDEVGDVTEDVMGKALLPVVGNAFGPVGRELKSDKSAKAKSPRIFVSLLD